MGAGLPSFPALCFTAMPLVMPGFFVSFSRNILRIHGRATNFFHFFWGRTPKPPFPTEPPLFYHSFPNVSFSQDMPRMHETGAKFSIYFSGEGPPLPFSRLSHILCFTAMPLVTPSFVVSFSQDTLSMHEIGTKFSSLF